MPTKKPNPITGAEGLRILGWGLAGSLLVTGSTTLSSDTGDMTRATMQIVAGVVMATLLAVWRWWESKV